jgi:hypothetical protein
MHRSFWLENLKYRNCLEDIGLRLRVIETDLYGRKNRRCETEMFGSGRGPVTRVVKAVMKFRDP